MKCSVSSYIWLNWWLWPWQKNPLQQGKGVQRQKMLLGASGPWILKQLPLEVEGSEVGTIRSSSSFSRTCVQCTSAWISKGSVAFMICCSRWLPATDQVQGRWERERWWGRRKEKINSQGKEGMKHHRKGNRKVTIFARISLNQKEAKIENMWAHANTHTRDFYSSTLM